MVAMFQGGDIDRLSVQEPFGPDIQLTRGKKRLTITGYVVGFSPFFELPHESVEPTCKLFGFRATTRVIWQ